MDKFTDGEKNRKYGSDSLSMENSKTPSSINPFKREVYIFLEARFFMHGAVKDLTGVTLLKKKICVQDGAG